MEHFQSLQIPHSIEIYIETWSYKNRFEKTNAPTRKQTRTKSWTTTKTLDQAIISKYNACNYKKYRKISVFKI